MNSVGIKNKTKQNQQQPNKNRVNLGKEKQSLVGETLSSEKEQGSELAMRSRDRGDWEKKRHSRKW